MTGKKAVLPPLGLLTLASLLPSDWESELVDMVFQEISESQWDRTELIMISGMAVQQKGMMEVIKEAKKRGKTVVVGGPWSFHIPEKILQAGADIVVRGEAEVHIGALLASIKKKDFGRIIQSDERADMTKSPPPRFDLLDLKSYGDMGIQFTRGCPFKCEFCDVTLMLGRKMRTKAPDQVFQELEILYNLGWRRLVFFVDDNFIGSVNSTKELLKELIPWMETRRRPFNFYTQASVNMAADEKLMEDMVRAGFTKVFIGVETSDKECLKDAGKLQNVNIDLDQVVQKITKVGFEIIAGTILGFDGEKSGAGKRLIDFARKNHIPELFTTLLQAAPGTDLYTRLKSEDRLLRIDEKNITNQTGLINFIPTRPLEEIANEFVDLYDTLYEPKAYLERAYYHYTEMDPSITMPFKMPYLWELKAVAILIYRNGVLYPTRFKFWKYLLKALWKFPTRLDRFITSLILAEHYYEFKNEIHSSIKSQLKELTPEFKNTYYTKPVTECDCERVGESTDQCEVHAV
jgi:radical SAM superfamily enzyme YgiQ (UPF0313 family)